MLGADTAGGFEGALKPNTDGGGPGARPKFAFEEREGGAPGGCKDEKLGTSGIWGISRSASFGALTDAREGKRFNKLVPISSNELKSISLCLYSFIGLAK